VNAPFVLDVKGGEKEEKTEYTTKGEKNKENQRSIQQWGRKRRKIIRAYSQGEKKLGNK
jgi:hypothetical protein